MKRFFKYLLSTVVVLFIWIVVVFFGTQKGLWHSKITKNDSSEAYINAAKEEIKKGFVGNFALATFKDGLVESEEFYSVEKPVKHDSWKKCVLWKS